MASLHNLPGIVEVSASPWRSSRQPIADGCRNEYDLSPHHGGQAGRLGEPLIPADQDADVGVAGPEDLVPQVSWRKVELFVITRVIGDVHLPVFAQIAAVGIDHDGRVVIESHRPLLEKACYDDNLQFRCQLAKHFERRIAFVDPLRKAKEAPIHDLAKVTRLEKLLGAHDLRTPAGSLSYVAGGFSQILGDILAARHLNQTKINGSSHPKPLSQIARIPRVVAE